MADTANACQYIHTFDYIHSVLLCTGRCGFLALGQGIRDECILGHITCNVAKDG